MLNYFYGLLVKLLYPTSMSILLLLAAAVLWRFKCAKLARLSYWLALAVLLICGNGWVVRYSTRHLERQYLAPDPLPTADCILVLGGGIWPKIPPRSTVEVAEAGDRVVYAAYLFRNGKAPRILCTSGTVPPGATGRPEASFMSELLENLGVPQRAILQETASKNTRDHGKNLFPLLQEQGSKRVLLVTSALHMPRSVAVFRRSCPGITFIPAPTDFRVVDAQLPWYMEILNLLPTPGRYEQFSETMHEYLGIAWYKIRGWI
jgi:uncharacterized SAM-binding protein YcdF (DUF218 family)